MFAIAADAHLRLYEVVAAMYGLTAVLVTIGRLRRPRGDSESGLVLAALWLGLPFYGGAAMMYTYWADTLLVVPHLFCLATHLFGLAWNYTTVVVVRRWLYDAPNRRLTIIQNTLFAVAAAVLVGSFVAMYPGPSEPNYLVYIRGSAVGDTYILTYAMSMLLAKVLIVGVCISQRSNLRGMEIRWATALVVVGSLGIAGYAVCRAALVLPLGGFPERWELAPTVLHILGAIIYLAGVVYAVRVSHAIAVASNVVDCLRLQRMCQAVSTTFPQLGHAPTVSVRDATSLDRSMMAIAHHVAYLSDASILNERANATTPAKEANGHPSVPTVQLIDSYSDFRSDRAHFIRASRMFRRNMIHRPIARSLALQTSLKS